MADRYPDILFFYQGGIDDGTAFFRKLWPEARAVSDMEQYFYRAFDIGRGGWKEMFGSQVWACGVRAAAKGHMIGAPVGDPWRMPGLFLIDSGRVIWHHTFAHAGDHPDWHKLATQLNAHLGQHPL